jgi:hypothetical protein
MVMKVINKEKLRAASQAGLNSMELDTHFILVCYIIHELAVHGLTNWYN